MQEPVFTILLGGALTPTDRLRAQIKGSRMLAADSGMRHAHALGLTPELWVGDFDSAAQDDLDTWPGVERMAWPAAKAETDGALAVEIARGRGARRLILAGALAGERSDHALQHLLAGVSLAEEGLDVLLTSGVEEAIPLLPGTVDLDLPPGALFSVLGLTRLDGLTIAGARYPLVRFTLPFGSSRTISNVADGPVSITLAEGRAVILARPFDLSGA